jgi:hypothetical protein
MPARLAVSGEQAKEMRIIPLYNATEGRVDEKDPVV